jgi:NhaP-type Na+/H+ or K+/H+ antiporter
LVIGIIAVIGAKSVNTLDWAIVLIVVGLVGGGLGGLLIVLSGVFGLINVLTKKLDTPGFTSPFLFFEIDCVK